MLKLKDTGSDPASPFSWDAEPSTSESPLSAPPSPPTSWLSARDMKLYGAQPLSTDIGIVKCKDCDKPILRSFFTEHADNCKKITAADKKLKGKAGGLDVDDPRKNSKKRKASPSPAGDSSQPNKKQKTKPLPKITKGRNKGPVDYDRHCGVINDKNLPCSRSLTCKSHSMGAKRAVQGRSRNYDELLIEWQRANNPNWVEPVKRESKAEKKEKKDREKAEKKRLAAEAAAAAGLDPNSKKGSGSGGGTSTSKKLSKKAKAAAAAAATRLADALGEDVPENLDDLDSEAEIDEMVKSIRDAKEKGIIAVPLALPCDASSWFVVRRERKRCCRELLVSALGSSVGGGLGGGMMSMSVGASGLGMSISMGMVSRTASGVGMIGRPL